MFFQKALWWTKWAAWAIATILGSLVFVACAMGLTSTSVNVHARVCLAGAVILFFGLLVKPEREYCETFPKKCLAILILAMTFSGEVWAQQPQIPEKQMDDIKSLAGIYFPNKQVTLYKNRFFVRDNSGYILTFEVSPDQRKVFEEAIDGQPGYEAIAALFLLKVDDYLRNPAQGPLGWGKNVAVKKIGGQGKYPDQEPSAGEELGRDLLK